MLYLRALFSYKKQGKDEYKRVDMRSGLRNI